MFKTYTNDFEISGDLKENKLSFLMRVPETGHVTTASLPMTTEILGGNLPSIFKCQCFNDANRGFNEECKNTELGHLFEHIMLEYLCMEKLVYGSEKAVFEGNTNWEIGIPNVFNIEIQVGLEDVKVIKKAFKKSVALLSSIIKCGHKNL